MRRLPYMSREWKDDHGRGVCLSVRVNDHRYSLRSYTTAREEADAIGTDVVGANLTRVLAELTNAVSIDMGEAVELYAG